MHISLDWISDYVDLAGLDIPAITNRLTLATAEVEGTKTIERFVKNVLVGEIKSAEKLTDKLTFCQVDCGSKTFSTVCGAPNVRIGLKAPFAPAGTILAGNVKVEIAERNGKPSQGILCSAAELGMSDWHEIILECPDNIPVGTPIERYIPETDTLIEIDNKSLTHRPDLWGHYGFAREFAAIFGRALKPLPQIDLSAYDSLPAYPLKNEDYENCPCYGCIEFQTRGTIPSPLVIQRRLHALGMRSYNLLVDVTNYVNWEIAQPTHAFDADKLGGIRVGTLGGSQTQVFDKTKTPTEPQSLDCDSSEFVTLDGQTRKLLPEDLLIWGSVGDVVAEESQSYDCGSATSAPSSAVSQYRPVALAGVMGGLETEVSAATVKLLLESANFKAARIRKTSTRLDLKTDASQRYEKSQPPSIVKTGVARILNLIQEAGAELKVLGKFTVDGNLQDEVRYIDIPPGRLELLSGITLPKEKVTQILQSLGFSVEGQKDGGIKVGVPPFRSQKDISIPEDIVEEVLRVYGYDNIPPVMPSVSVVPMFVEKHLKMEHKIKRILSAAHRFLEVHNYIWFNDHWLKTLDYEPGETLVLKNSTTPETSRLRTTLIPNLLALVPKNRPFRETFRLFEVARVFLDGRRQTADGSQTQADLRRQTADGRWQPDASDDSESLDNSPGDAVAYSAAVCRLPSAVSHEKSNDSTERHYLAGIAFQRTGSFEDFYLSVKSAIEDVLEGCGVTNVVFKESPSAQYPWQTPGNFVTIYIGDKPLGTLGILDKAMTAKVCREGGQIVWFEINLDDLAGTLYPEIKFEEPPRYPLSWQDFSLLWNVEAGFDKLESVLDKFANPLVIRREFLVSYRGKGVEKGSACYSFRFWIGSPDHTLTGEEIETFHGEFLRYIKENGVSLRI